MPLSSPLRRSTPYVASAAVQALAQFVALPILSRQMDASDFGSVALAQSGAVVVTILVSCGVPGAITRMFFYVEGGKAHSKVLALHAAAVQLAVSLLAMAACLTLIQGHRGVVIATAIAIGASMAAQQSTLAVLRAEGQSQRYLVVVSGTLLLPPAIALFVCESTGYAARTYLLAHAGSLLLLTVLATTLHLRDGHRRIPLFLFRWVPRFALPLVPHSVALSVMASGDRIVIGSVLDLEAVGEYQVGYLIGAAPIAVLLAVNNILAPDLYATRPELARDKLLQQSARFNQVAATMTVFVAYLSPLAVGVLVPDSYERDTIVLVALLTSLSALAYADYLNQIHAFFIIGRTSLLAVSTPSAAMFSIGLSFVGADLFGLPGAAAASVAGYVALTVITGFIRSRLAEGWNASRVPAFAVGNVVGLIALPVLLSKLGVPAMVLAAAGTAGCCLYAWKTFSTWQT